ncbi:MAG: NAD(P)H-dependent oxidoreductase [Muribaculaceae bacterium]|nr:NAD(P)H-dependent oxidoreductase [Muribaculaceae bacterium]
MKNSILILACLILTAVTGHFAQAATVPAAEARCMVVYYSYSGVTKTLAQAVAADCNGTLIEVIDHGQYPRPESSTTYTYANNERSQIDAGVWPEINTAVDSFDDYDVVIICTPLWNGKMANPMLTFLHNHADMLIGKQVALAVTSWSSGITNVVTDAHSQLPNSTFVGTPLHIDYNNRSNINAMANDWINSLNVEVEESGNDQSINVIVGNKTFEATVADSETGRAFYNMLPLTLNMNELNGNEKYCYLDTSLPTDSYSPGTINAGDIMLYGSSCVVLFYETFTSGYSYTRIGAVDDPEGLAQALGSGNVTVKFEKSSSAVTGISSFDGEKTIVAIYDLRGIAILHNNIAQLPKGIYVVKYKNGETKKIVK